MTKNFEYKMRIAVKVLLILIINLLPSCDSPPISVQELSNSKLVEIIINEKELEKQKDSAIEELKIRKAWKDLVKTLPPTGRYGGASLNVIDAIHEIGNVDAVPHLKRVLKTKEYMSGEFRIHIKAVIKEMESSKIGSRK